MNIGYDRFVYPSVLFDFGYALKLKKYAFGNWDTTDIGFTVVTDEIWVRSESANDQSAHLRIAVGGFLDNGKLCSTILVGNVIYH